MSHDDVDVDKLRDKTRAFIGLLDCMIEMEVLKPKSTWKGNFVALKRYMTYIEEENERLEDKIQNRSLHEFGI